jgi:hypothetical protein
VIASATLLCPRARIGKLATGMKTEPIPSDREVLAGLVERVTYQNAENGFRAASQGEVEQSSHLFLTCQAWAN